MGCFKGKVTKLLVKILATDLRKYIGKLKCGDRILLSGEVYTARDAAHRRIFHCIENNTPLPFQIKDSVIYYAGPTQTPPDALIGACGPTTSSRMDKFTPTLFDMGMCATIGKGPRSEEVKQAIIRNRGIYLCALGGGGALATKSIKECEIIAFEELGCESIKRLVLEDFPLIVGIDSKGNSIF